MPPDFTVLAIIAAYNEADIIGQVIGHLLDQAAGTSVNVVSKTSGRGSPWAIGASRAPRPASVSAQMARSG